MGSVLACGYRKKRYGSVVGFSGRKRFGSKVLSIKKVEVLGFESPIFRHNSFVEKNVSEALQF